MLPIRIIVEAMGGTVLWDADTKTVMIRKGDVEIIITIGSDTALVNGKEVTLDVSAFIENGRTFLPLRFIAENLGCTVTWDAATKTVTIK